jgi:DNA-directed RNA polymerase subunit RPC12/RpoP
VETTPSATPPEAEPELTCPHCGSFSLRRSAPHGFGERFLRTFTPFHFYRCRDCGRRGAHLGRVSGRGSARTGRPVEGRDVRATRTRRRRRLVALFASLGLGVAAGVFVHSCQQRTSGSVLP